MKIFSGIIVLVFILSTAFLSPTDYRDNYTGYYDCVSKCQVSSEDYSKISYAYGSLEVLVTKNEEDSLLDITINEQKIVVRLENGIMYPAGMNKYSHGKFFASDSIVITQSTGRAPSACTYRGKKN